MSSNDKRESAPPTTPPTTPTTESLQESIEQPKTTIHRLAMASAMAMVNQFQKIENTNPPPTKK